jgi:hypothetical protein
LKQQVKEDAAPRVTKCINILNDVEYAFVVVIAVSISIYITK